MTQTQLDYWNTIHQMMRGYRISHLLITCAQLEVFGQLAAGPLPLADLAERTQTAPAALRRLLDAAVAFELLTKDGERYANSPLADTCLAREGPYYLGNLLRREGAFYQRWSYLTEAVRSGRRPEANIRDEEQTDWVLGFELALYDLARVNGPLVAEALALSEEQTVRVLDVGGGHGGYSMALARRYPNIEATVFELPPAAEVARQIIAREGMGHRVGVGEGDFQNEELGDNAYDLLLLFGVLVSETPANKLALLEKSFRALLPGGRVAIRAFWLNDERTGPPESTLFSLHMLLATDAGDISTQAEIMQLLAQTNFIDPQWVNIPEVGGNLLLATKPTR